jgi:hypothetical protein
VSSDPEWQHTVVVGITGDASVFDVRGGKRSIVYTPALQAGNRCSRHSRYWWRRVWPLRFRRCERRASIQRQSLERSELTNGRG